MFIFDYTFAASGDFQDTVIRNVDCIKYSQRVLNIQCITGFGHIGDFGIVIVCIIFSTDPGTITFGTAAIDIRIIFNNYGHIIFTIQFSLFIRIVGICNIVTGTNLEVVSGRIDRCSVNDAFAFNKTDIGVLNVGVCIQCGVLYIDPTAAAELGGVHHITVNSAVDRACAGNSESIVVGDGSGRQGTAVNIDGTVSGDGFGFDQRFRASQIDSSTIVKSDTVVVQQQFTAILNTDFTSKQLNGCTCIGTDIKFTTVNSDLAGHITVLILTADFIVLVTGNDYFAVTHNFQLPVDTD